MPEKSDRKVTAAEWKRIAPILDELVATLGKDDRLVLLLRFYARASVQDLGEGLGIDGDSAQRRIDRAFRKLKGMFERRGIVVSAKSLSTALWARVLEAGPSNMESRIMAGLGPDRSVISGRVRATAARALRMMDAVKVQGRLQR